MQLRDIMTKYVETIGYDASLRYAATLMQNENVGFLPVMRDGLMVGVITDRDITVRAVSKGLSPEETIVEQAMTENIVALPENTEVEDAADLMDARKVRRLVVTDELESLVGVVSLDTLSMYIGRYGTPSDRFQAEGHEDPAEFSRDFDPAKSDGEAENLSAVADEPASPMADPDPAEVFNDPSVTAEAEVTMRDARDQADPRKGPRSLIIGG